MVTAKRSRSVVQAVAVIALLGCRQIVGFDAAHKSLDAADGGGATPLPPLPFAPDADYADTCQGCAQTRCTAERQLCEDDTRCREILSCRGACSDPLCIARCGSYELLDFGNYRHGEESRTFGDYLECVTSQCASDCGWGVSWGCLDGKTYRWPTRREQAKQQVDFLHVELELLYFASAAEAISARLTPCLAVDCSDPLSGSVETNGWGQAAFMLNVDPGVFDGYWQIATAQVDQFNERWYLGRPMFRELHVVRPVWSAQDPSFGLDPSGERALIGIGVVDCLDAPASGIAFELDGATGQAYAYVTDGMGEGKLFDGAATDPLGLGGIRNVTPTSGTVTVLAKRNGELVGRRRVQLRQGWVTSLVLWPRTVDD